MDGLAVRRRRAASSHGPRASRGKRRWIVRATNNGFTASFDPYGRIFEPLPPDVRAAADLPYDFRTDETLYTRFGGLVRLALRARFRYSSCGDFSKGKVTSVP